MSLGQGQGQRPTIQLTHACNFIDPSYDPPTYHSNGIIHNHINEAIKSD